MMDLDTIMIDDDFNDRRIQKSLKCNYIFY